MTAADSLDRLVQAARAGDVEAFTALVEALAPDLQAFVAARARSADLVDEVVQAAFVTAWERLGAYEARGSFAAWVKGIAHNHLREELRRLRRTLPDHDLAERLVVDACLVDLDRAEEDAARDRRLAACLERLPERTRRIVRRRYWEDESLAELAQRFHAPAEALAALLYRARKALLGCLEGGG
jgi:RNA polymerase sigma-70 factor (ECF subfamily)